MATSSTKPGVEVSNLAGVRVPDWATRNDGADSTEEFREKPTQLDALQALLAFSALHDQIRRRRSLAARHSGFDAPVAVAEFEFAVSELFFREIFVELGMRLDDVVRELRDLARVHHVVGIE